MRFFKEDPVVWNKTQESYNQNSFEAFIGYTIYELYFKHWKWKYFKLAHIFQSGIKHNQI